MPFRDVLRYLAAFAGLVALGAGCYRSARLAWADHLFRLDTEASLAEAVRLAPDSGEYHARFAELLDDAGRDDKRIEAELQEAVAVQPRLASAWSELGLRAEARGWTAQAETFLAHAAQLDHTYAVLWTLANFYFRHNESEKFWLVARRALRIGDVEAYDPAPLFRLAWKISGDPAVVLQRAIPSNGPVPARYLEFLVRQNLTAVAGSAAERVVASGSEQDLDAVFEYCDRRITAGDADAAIHAWNALCRRALPGYRALAPDAAALINGDFSSAPSGHGFDWRRPALTGVTVERAGPPTRLRITFDGHEPDTCDVLEQYLALSPARKYRLRFRYQTDDVAAQSGLRWRIRTVAGDEIPSDAADLASEQETGAALRFTAPAGVRLARLVLEYQRAPGAVRLEGRIGLATVALEFDP